MRSLLPISARALWLSLRTSFWFVPTMMAAGAFGVSLIMIYLDQTLDHELAEKYPTFLAANASGARSILSAIAGSMITVAGVTFSVTIVALSLASNQYTPRILRNFMSDKGNQIVLGAFVSVFIYSLVVLRAIRGGEESFIPSYALLVGIALAFVAMGFLIFFVHHIATMVQASTILANIYEETLGVIDDLYPRYSKEELEVSETGPFQPSSDDSETVLSVETGYIQDFDEAALIDWAERNEVVLEMLAGIGEFVAAGAPLLRIHGTAQNGEGRSKELAKCFGIARGRTIEQDPAFGIRQIVDVALKALSPGINDTTTAASCVDYLSAILFDLGKREIAEPERCKGGRVRLIACTPTFQSLADLSFNEIRQHARDNVSIYIKLLSAIGKAATTDSNPATVRILWEHVKSIVRAANRQIQISDDRALINQAVQQAATSFGKDFQQLLLSDNLLIEKIA